MNGSDILASIEKTLIVAALAACYTVLVYLALKAVKLITGREELKVSYLCTVSFVFGILGLVSGIITASSRSAAVGQVLPAALGFIGAVALYVITKSEIKISIAAAAVTAFSLLLFQGTVLGSYERLRAVTYRESLRYDAQMLKAKADTEFVINAYRSSRGLDPVEFDQ